MAQLTTDEPSKSNWWDAYPAFKSHALLITVEELAVLLSAKDESVAVIDVRRNDHAVRPPPMFLLVSFQWQYRAATSEAAHSGLHSHSMTISQVSSNNTAIKGRLSFIVIVQEEGARGALGGMLSVFLYSRLLSLV